MSGKPVTEDQIEECAKLLAKMWSQERDYPFWGNEMVYFRKVVRDLCCRRSASGG